VSIRSEKKKIENNRTRRGKSVLPDGEKIAAGEAVEQHAASYAVRAIVYPEKGQKSDRALCR
jgi:hypothetical protein